MTLTRYLLSAALLSSLISFTNAATIDIVTYNIEWLGTPGNSDFSGSRSQQINAAASDIINGGGEIYALQEIGGSRTLNDLLSRLNSLDNNNNWSGSVSQPSGSQSLAFVYKTSVVTGVSFQQILTHRSSRDFAGRFPYMMTANVSVGGDNRPLNLINLHLKCCTGGSNSSRRNNAMREVVAELHRNYRTDNMIVLGDLNVASQGGANGEIRDWGIYQDRDNNGLPDYYHAAGSVADIRYNPNNPDTDIDHILISDELRAAWNAVSTSTRNRYLNTTVSDHSPVATRLEVSLFGEATTTPNPTPDPGPSPDPAPSNALSVTQALSQSAGTTMTVVGIIEEAYNDIYALRMHDANNPNTDIIVKLEKSQRNQWSPELNPGVIGNKIEVTGRRDTYTRLPSIESVSQIREVR
ncbi:endonuclease/exonuclease/phosphatase family protein [Marinibactrum halimedae]|uniref:Endonuclease/exonuclease/phosphatase domain-containing protein n=1 Tax=Marinibactrum halimedae TaxID=1444977 RepID=A0AA37T8X3_9GAMM|nr:endonuclease/exonuclease/phosphatase family protein [Marinibactrum halimedae]MCD9458934.1 hypothetical protein [Marinibactrum halimedae]GLS27781.1 hypothetical protein GCM10007877_35000 [Marinibactrum halimedae]